MKPSEARPGMPGFTKHHSLLLENARIVDVAKGAFFDATGLLVRDGRISTLVNDEQARTVSADRRLDLGGLFIIPGLINAHCHISMPGGFGLTPRMLTRYRSQVALNAERCITNGVTTVRDMMGLGGFVLGLQRDIAAGRVKGPRILSSVGVDVARGYGRQTASFGRRHTFREANTPAEAVRAVNEALDMGADFIKLFAQKTEHFLPGRELPQMSLAAMAAASEAANRRGSYAALHQTALHGLGKGLSAGIRSLEHVPGDGPIPEQDMERILSSGATVVPTLSVPFLMGFEMPGDPNWGKGHTLAFAKARREALPGLLAEFCDPLLAPAAARLFAMLDKPENYVRYRRCRFFCPLTITAEAVWGVENLKALFRAGARLGMGNDGGIPLVFPGALWLEMRIWEELGIPAPAVLAAATIGNARAAGREGRLGAIAPGMPADLAVLREDPLRSLRNVSRPLLVFKEGELLHNRLAGGRA